MKGVYPIYIVVYKGIRGKWRFGIHTSVYVQGDPYEWAYGGSSSFTSYRGVIYERNKEFLYGDWTYWKSVRVGDAPSLYKGDEATSRLGIKELVGSKYSDDGYHWLRNNCWHFCYDLLSSLNIHVPRTTIECMNDERLLIYRGCTRFTMTYILQPVSILIGYIVSFLVTIL